MTQPQPQSRTNPQAQPSNKFNIGSETTERAVIGAALGNPSNYPAMASVVTAEDFTDEWRALAWTTIGAMLRDETIDSLTVMHKMGDNPEQKSAALARLARCLGSCPEPANGMRYAEQLRSDSRRREIATAGQAMVAMAKRGSVAIEDTQAQALRLVLAATQQRGNQDHTMLAASHRFMDNLAAAAEGNAPLPILTGISNWDKCKRGLTPGHVTLLMGQSGMGKTTLALSVARNAAIAGKRVVVFSIEMTENEIMTELVAMHSGVHRAAMREGTVSKIQMSDLVRAVGELSTWDMVLYERRDFAPTPSGIALKLHLLAADKPADLVVIDGLWLMQSGNPKQDGGEEHVMFKSIVAELVDITADFKCATILIHQYNTGAYGADQPALQFTGGGQRVHNTVQQIYALWRTKDDQPELYNLKHRGGVRQIEPIPLHYNHQFSRYEGTNEHDEQPIRQEPRTGHQLAYLDK